MSDDTPAAGRGGEGSGLPDANAPEVQALIREAVDQEVAGLKATNANLKDEKRALAERVKTADGRIVELETLVEARDEQLGSLVVDDRIRDAAAKAGLIASATEDARPDPRRRGQGRPDRLGDRGRLAPRAAGLRPRPRGPGGGARRRGRRDPGR
jgi:hypothetical protein